jgi:hypothetical protein
MDSDLVDDLARFAASLDRVTESVACRGTALEKITYQVRGKNFLFLGRTDLMMKLRDGLEEAAELANAAPEAVRVGKHGWVTFVPANASRDTRDRLKRWIAESHAVVGGR